MHISVRGPLKGTYVESLQQLYLNLLLFLRALKMGPICLDYQTGKSRGSYGPNLGFSL